MKEMILGVEEGEIIQLVHANGYAPGCYKKLSGQLENYKIVLPELRPMWEGEDASKLKSWKFFADDLIKHMDEQGRRDAIGIGHSLGGIVTWVAACKRPDLFKRLILIDPVILPAFWHNVMSIVPFWLKRKILPMVDVAMRRTHEWKDKEEFRTYLHSKKVFKRFDPEVLEDYAEHGIKDHAEGVTLSFPREWEARIYGSSPNMWGEMNTPSCPISIIRAEFSDVITDDRWSKIKSRFKEADLRQIDKVGHLIPFEKPEACGKLIMEILSQ